MTFEFRLDISRCIGCKACEVACVTANDLDPRNARNWVPHLEDSTVTNGATTFAPYLCHHCEDAPCVDACPTGASFTADDGRVLVDHDLCIGCGLCVTPCPYDARYIAPDSQKIEKCTLCESRVHHGQAPACFEVCPAGARTFREIVEIDGVTTEIAVGDVDAVDADHDEIQLVTDQVNPHPVLRFSGLADDLDLLTTLKPPLDRRSPTESIWRGGGAKAMVGIGFASAAVMGTMVGLRALRDRKAAVAAATQDESDQITEDDDE